MIKKLVLTLACILSIAGIASAQVSKVTGTVTFADDGTPVIGASVFVKGTTVGTVTDIDGKYVLTNVPANAKTLVFSYIGMKTEEVPVKPEVNMSMSAGTETIEEAVVQVAYGAAKKSSLTGAVASVDAEKIENRITTDVTTALEGTVAGIQVNSSTAAPGESPTIRIRGIGTINGDQTPLYVVDGVPYDGDSADLNPSDIESVSVLKDAASAALYGNRASNGVVLITTKKGSNTGKIQMRFDTKQGIYTRGQGDYETLGPNDWMEMQWQTTFNRYKSKGDDVTTAANKTNANFVNTFTKLNIYDVPDNQLFDSNGKLNPIAKIREGYLDDLNWFDSAYRVGWRQEYNLSASAGTDKSDYRFSLGYLNEQGYVINADFSRLSGRVAVNTKPFKWFKTGLNISGSYQNLNHSNGTSDDGESYTNYFYVCRRMAPIYPVHIHNPKTGEYVYDANGEKMFSTGYYTDEYGFSQPTRNQFEDRNILWENTINQDKTRKVIMNATAYADFYFLKDFTFTVKGTLNLRNTTRYRYYSSEIGAYKGTGAASRLENAYITTTIQEQLRWSHQFGNHSVSVLVAHENYSNNRDYYYAYKDTEINPGQTNLNNFTQLVDLYNYEQDYRTESYLGRVRYNYKDKYNVEGSFRRDGSSRFSSQARWGNFWSLGANWMISHEGFMKDVEWVNTLKLRADYGEVGNDAGASKYASYDLYTIDQNYNQAAYYYSQRENPNLRWETSQSWGVGIEARFFKRWNFNVEYFDKRNKDLLFDVYSPISAGATSSSSSQSTTTMNLGTISNRGVEIETDVDVIKNRRWKWNVGGNGTYLKNEVLSLPEGNEKGIVTQSNRQRIKVGKSLYNWYLYEWAGVDQMDGRGLYVPNLDSYCITENDSNYGKVLWGTPKYNPDGSVSNRFPKSYRVINGQPYTVSYTYARRDDSKDAHPKFFGSISSTLSYRNWTLSAMFTYSLGGYSFDAVYQSLMSPASTVMHNYSSEVLSRTWIGIPVDVEEDSPNRLNPDAAPKFNAYYTSSDNATSTRFLISSSYFIIKNAKLSYSIPKKAVKNIGLRGITVSVTGENLFTFSAREGFNPQQSLTGYHSNVFVAPRIITLDLSIKF